MHTLDVIGCTLGTSKPSKQAPRCPEEAPKLGEGQPETAIWQRTLVFPNTGQKSHVRKIKVRDYFVVFGCLWVHFGHIKAFQTGAKVP